MNDYIKQWLDIIETMNNENTYKLAWGRALLEIINEIKEEKDSYIIHFNQISEKMLKYYWNQIFFFKLKQSPSRVPIVVQITQQCIDYYISKTNSTYPIWFDKAQPILKENSDFYQKTIRKISSTLTVDVSWRFKISRGASLNIYELSKEKKEVYFTHDQVMDLKEYGIVLSQLLNYRWAQLLERFNNAPRIVSKVKGISDNKISRGSLTKFKDILLENMVDGIPLDFYTGKVLDDNDISVDHVIPWSFMYSDDIWNLVLTSKSNNSSKSNSIPTKETILKLEERNKAIVSTIKQKKSQEEMLLAIENDYVNKFYLACKM